MTSGSAAEPDLRPLRERLADLRIDTAGTLEEAVDRLYAAGLTDGLPVIPPTTARIAVMLAACRPSADLRLEPLPPAFAAPTLWDVAVCLVLAGGLPEYLPVLVSALHAVADPAFNLLGIQTTTGSAAPMLIVNGPLAVQLEINAGANCLGQGRRANAALGRALRLLLQNVGAAIPGVGDMATLGQPGKYTWCLAENEAESPWPPFHATRGLAADTSAVTAVGAAGSIEAVLGTDDPGELAARLGQVVRAVGGPEEGPSGGRKQVLVLLPPESARFLHGHGWDRDRLAGEVLRFAGPLTGTVNGTASGGGSGVEMLIVVAGGTGIKAAVVPAWSGTTRAVTRTIEPI